MGRALTREALGAFVVVEGNGHARDSTARTAATFDGLRSRTNAKACAKKERVRSPDEEFE